MNYFFQNLMHMCMNTAIRDVRVIDAFLRSASFLHFNVFWQHLGCLTSIFLQSFGKAFWIICFFEGSWVSYNFTIVSVARLSDWQSLSILEFFSSSAHHRSVAWPGLSSLWLYHLHALVTFCILRDFLYIILCYLRGGAFFQLSPIFLKSLWGFRLNHFLINWFSLCLSSSFSFSLIFCFIRHFLCFISSSQMYIYFPLAVRPPALCNVTLTITLQSILLKWLPRKQQRTLFYLL